MGIESPKTRGKLIKDLENLHQTLSEENISKTPEQLPIPLLDQIVGQQKTVQSSNRNPFLSSKTLEDLIAKRNDAESKAAAELASMGIKSKGAFISGPELQEISNKLDPDSQKWIHQIIEDIPLIVGQVMETHMPVIQAAVQLELVSRIEQLINMQAEQESDED